MTNDLLTISSAQPHHSQVRETKGLRFFTTTQTDPEISTSKFRKHPHMTVDNISSSALTQTCNTDELNINQVRICVTPRHYYHTETSTTW